MHREKSDVRFHMESSKTNMALDLLARVRVLSSDDEQTAFCVRPTHALWKGRLDTLPQRPSPERDDDKNDRPSEESTALARNMFFRLTEACASHAIMLHEMHTI